MKKFLLCLFAAILGVSGNLQAQQGPPAFGTSAIIAGSQVLISEPVANGGPGFVYVFAKDDDGSWSEVQRLTTGVESGEDRIGIEMLHTEGYLLLSSTREDSAAGAVHVFRNDSGTWNKIAKVQPSDVQPGDKFGGGMAINGNMALIASVEANDGAGKVYAFEMDESEMIMEKGSFAPDDLEKDDTFGQSIAWVGNTAMITALRANGGKGAVYLYEERTDGWNMVERIQPDDLGSNALFGFSLLAESDDRFLASAIGNNFYSGEVYEYQKTVEGWSHVSSIKPPSGAMRAQLGAGIQGTMEKAFVGVAGANQFKGAVIGFVRNAEGEWAAADTLSTDGLKRGNRFGAAFDMSDDIVVATVPGADFGAGNGVIFEKDADGVWSQSATVFGDIGGMDAISGEKVDCEDGSAAGFECDGVDLVSFVPKSQLGGSRGANVNDVWGWTDPETGNEIAIVGRVDGTAFVDITDPANPVVLGDLPMTEGSNGNVWRDMKVFKDHVFIVADNSGAHGMQVYDLTQLRDLENTPALLEQTAHYDKINSAHNIVINEETGFAYSVGTGGGGETCGGGLHMIDINDPTNPTFAGCFADPTTGRSGTGYSHDAQCVVYTGPDTEHHGKEICFGSNETALSIGDVTDKENPVSLSTGAYPNVGYAHQGWLTEDQKYFYMNDELDELGGQVENTRTLIWDVSDLDEPVLVKEHFLSTTASDHNLYIKGNLMYQSNYKTGLRILDITDVANPVEVAHFDTTPTGDNDKGFDGSWSNYPYFKSGNVVVTSVKEGLFVVRKKQEGI